MDKFIPPRTSWHYGILIISKAFYGVPPDFNNWPIYYWEHLCADAKKLIEADYKKVF